MTLEELQKEVDKLNKQVKDQNTYITTLEKQRNSKAPGNEPSPAPQGTIDPRIIEHLQGMMRENTIDKAMTSIKAQNDSKLIELLQPELDKFLEDRMTLERTTVDFVKDAYSYVLGKAISDKKHQIHSLLGKTQDPPNQGDGKSGTPPQQQPFANVKPKDDGQPQSQPSAPPIMSNSDRGLNTPGPVPGGYEPPKSTKEAINSFAKKLGFSR